MVIQVIAKRPRQVLSNVFAEQAVQRIVKNLIVVASDAAGDVAVLVEPQGFQQCQGCNIGRKTPGRHTL